MMDSLRPTRATTPGVPRRVRHTARSGRLLLVLAALALLAAACGGPAAESEAPAPGAEAEADGETPAEDGGGGGLDTVSVGVTSLHTWYWWIMAAQAEGLMEPHGIQLDVVPVSSTAQLVNALVGGSLQFVHVAPTSIFAVQEGEPGVKVVASVLISNPYTMIVRPDVAGVEDIEGGVLGVTTIGSSADYFTCKLLLVNAGLEENQDYSVVNTGPTAQRAAAMLSGEIDAACNFEPSLLQLQDEGMQTLESAADYPNFEAEEVINLNATEEWYTENRDVAVRFMQGFLDSLEWINDPANRDRAIELLAEEMEVSDEHATATYDRFFDELDAFSKDGLVSLERLENTVENARAGGVEFVPELDDLDSRYDNSLVEEAAAG